MMTGDFMRAVPSVVVPALTLQEPKPFQTERMIARQRTISAVAHSLTELPFQLNYNMP